MTRVSRKGKSKGKWQMAKVKSVFDPRRPAPLAARHIFDFCHLPFAF
jgi:hypothetical protein